MRQENPLEQIKRAPEVSVSNTLDADEFIIDEQLVFNATTSPEIVKAFKSSPNKIISCRAIAEALQTKFVKENQGIVDQNVLDIMAIMIYERLSSN